MLGCKGLRKASRPKNCNGSGTNNYLEKKIKTSLALPVKISLFSHEEACLFAYIPLQTLCDSIFSKIFK